MPSTSPTCPMVISVTSRWNPTRPAALAPDLPRSSSITSTRGVGQPSATARSTSPYCSRVDSPWSATCWRVDWRTYTTASRSSCRSPTLLPSRSHGSSVVMAAPLHQPDPRRRRPPRPPPASVSPPPGWPAPPATQPPPGGWPPAALSSTAWPPTVGPGSSPVVHDDPPSSPRARARSRSTTSTSRNSPSRPSIGVCPIWSSFIGAFCLADGAGLRASQGRGWPGPLPGPPVRRLVPAHHSRDGRARLPGRHPRSAHRPVGRGRGAVVVTALGVLVTLTVPELRRLLVRLVWSPRYGPGFTLGWSVWRRRHQATARRCHYQQQRTKLRL